MRKVTIALAASVLVLGAIAAPASAGSFHPLRTARAAADLGLDTARRAIDLGLDTAKGAVDVAEDAVTPDNCRPGARYKGSDGRWHDCR